MGQFQRLSELSKPAVLVMFCTFGKGGFKFILDNRCSNIPAEIKQPNIFLINDLEASA